MNDDFEFDDPQLGRALGRLSGPTPDVGAAYETFRQRAHIARRRRTAAWMMSGTAVIALFVMVAAALPGGEGEGRIVPAESTDPTTEVDGPDTSSTVSLPDSTVTLPDGTNGVTTGRVPDGQDVTAMPVEDDDSGSDELVSDDPGPDGSGSDTESHSNSGPDTTTKTTTKPPTTPASTTPTTPPSTNPPSTTGGGTGGETVTTTCSSFGGSLTARRQNGDLAIIATNPATGWRLDETEDGEDEVKAKFEEIDGEGQWEVRADWNEGSSTISCSSKND